MNGPLTPSLWSLKGYLKYTFKVYFVIHLPSFQFVNHLLKYGQIIYRLTSDLSLIPNRYLQVKGVNFAFFSTFTPLTPVLFT